jgi:hypothetical protein
MNLRLQCQMEHNRLQCQLKVPKRESWLNNFFGKIGDQLEDLTYVSIITGTGNTYAKIQPGADNIVEELEKNQITILARTNIELDGDITIIVPTKDGQGVSVNQEIMTIHKENTAVAVANWNNFMNMIMQVIKIIAELAGMKNVDVLDKLSFKTTAS